MILVGFLCVISAVGLLVAGLAQGNSALVWASIATSALGGVVVVIAAIRRDRAALRGRADAASSVAEPLATVGSQGSVEETVFSSPPGRSWTASGAASSPPVADPSAAGVTHALDVGLTQGRATLGADGPDSVSAEDGYRVDREDDSTDEFVLRDAASGLGRRDVLARVDTFDETLEAADAAEEADAPEGTDPTGALPPEDEPAEEEVDLADVLTVIDLVVPVLVVDLRPRYHLEGCGHLKGREAVPLPVKEAREDGFTPCGLCRPDSALATAARRTRSFYS